jgi:ATP-binding cassette subfamily F protein 3
MLVRNIKKVINGMEILSDVSFEINKTDKIGVVGINGSGKSTLFRILSGELEQTNGEIIKLEKLAYLRQEIPEWAYNLSIIDFLYKDTGIGELKQKIELLQDNISQENMEEFCNLCEHFSNVNGYDFENTVKKMLNKLGIEKNIEDKISTLSGGEKIKILLTSLMLHDADILLLDEPTNNLDIESVNYLCEFLKKTEKALLIISHDNLFLSSVTNKTLEIKNGVSKLYKYNYSTLLNVKDVEYEKEYLNFLETKDKIKEIKNKISDTKRKMANSQSKNSSSTDNDKIGRNYNAEKGQKKSGNLLKKLQNSLDDANVSISGFKKRELFEFIVNTQNFGQIKDIKLQNLVCGYDNFQTNQINATIPYGSRVLITGKNGAGKSTLIKTLLGDIKPVSGEFSIDSNMKFGYIEQDTIVERDNNLTLDDYLTKNLANIEKSKIYTVLHNLQIEYEDKDKKYMEFSAGERTKINLAKLSLQNINGLILDEPTNHLDLEATKILFEAIKTFTGTVFAISHNLTFIEEFGANIIINMNTGVVEYI